MNRNLKVLILQHEEPTPPGYLLEWLEEQRADVDVHRIDLHEVTQDPRDYDFIASLGSEFAAFDDSKPFIPREAELLRAAAGREADSRNGGRTAGVRHRTKPRPAVPSGSDARNHGELGQGIPT